MTDVLPYNEDAETQAVGACLISKSALEIVAETLREGDIYQPSIARVYKAILSRHERSAPVDAILIAEDLAGSDTDVHKVRELAVSVTSTANAQHHAGVVRDYRTRRDLIGIGQNIARLGWETGEPDVAVDEAERMVTELTVERDPGDLQHIRESLEETFRILDTPGGVVTGTPTGLHDLDRLTSGFQPGQLIVIASRPSMGKSALVTSTIIHNAVSRNRPAALFSIEMSRQEINQRILSQIAGVDLMRIRTRNGLTQHDRDNLDRARPIIENAPIHTDDSGNLRLTDIRGRARRFHRRNPDLALVAVDYLQLMATEGRADNRNEEISRISRGLKVLARELEVPVVALAQLNRTLEARHDKRPILSDIRDSGAIEQDADLVIFLYRDDYYNKASERPGVTELLLAKHRNGPTGMVETAWLKDRAQFADLAPEAS